MKSSLVTLLRVTGWAFAGMPLLLPEGIRSPWEFVGLAVAGLLHIEVGSRLCRADPQGRLGLLMLVSGMLWLINTWGWTSLPVLCGQALLLSLLYDPLLLHGSLIVPAGRLHGQLDRLIAGLAYLFWPAVIGAGWLLGAMRAPIVDDLLTVRSVGYPVIGAGLLLFFGLRYRRAAPATRRAFAPYWTAIFINAMTTTALSTTPYSQAVWPTLLYAVGAALVPVGAALSMARTSRHRLIEASDRERQRVERNVHDGVQQRLLAATLLLRQAQRHGDVALAERGASEVETAIAELRELVRGMNPPALVRYGLAGAIASIGDRSEVDVEVDNEIGQLNVPEPVAVTAYYVALEAVANSQKHAAAQAVKVRLARSAGHIVVTIQDNGVGGANPAPGGGLIGLRDRVESCGGTFRLASARGRGTTVRASLPIGGAR